MNIRHKENLKRLKGKLPILEQRQNWRVKKSEGSESYGIVDKIFTPPIPETHKGSWQIRYTDFTDRKTLSKQFKDNIFPPYNLSELKNYAKHNPELALTIISKLQKKNPGDPELKIISAYCSLDSSITHIHDPGDLITKMAPVISEFGTGLMTGAFSIYNLNSFIKFYYIFLDKLTLALRSGLRTLNKSQIFSLNEEIMIRKQEVLQLLRDKNHIKEKMDLLFFLKMGSIFHKHFDLFKIRDACILLIKGQENAEIEGMLVKDYIRLVQELGGILARIPLLRPLFNELVNQIPLEYSDLSVRKYSLVSRAEFLDLKLAIIREKSSIINYLCKSIFEANLRIVSAHLRKSENWRLKTNAYNDLATVVLLSAEFLDSNIKEELIKRAISSQETFMELNQTGDQIYNQRAKANIERLEKTRLD